MPDTNLSDGLSRRRLLQTSGGVFGLVGTGATRVVTGDRRATTDGKCPEATIGPGMVHYDDSMHEVCADDHPETEALQAAVRTSLEEKYSTVGALIDAGFLPYLDFFDDGDWSHWLSPEFIGDDSMLDPDRPESILVDHTWWRPIGVMFIATDEGKPVDPPPSIYGDETTDESGDDRSCTPWHAHVGVPGRYSWWKYQKASSGSATFPCRTPWMLHVWIYSHPESIYAHAAPEERGGPPAEDPGFDTDVDPNEEELAPEHLSASIRDKIRAFYA